MPCVRRSTAISCRVSHLVKRLELPGIRQETNYFCAAIFFHSMRQEFFLGFLRESLARALVRLIFPQRMHGVARRNGLHFGFFGACGNVVYAV